MMLYAFLPTGQRPVSHPDRRRPYGRETRLAALLLLAASLICGPVRADQTVEQDGWVLHYMTLNTTELTPEVAQAYDVRRSARRGLLMLNLQHKDAPQVSVDHSTDGRIRNLIGQTKTTRSRRVEAGGAIYTLVEYSYTHLETLRFEFSVLPAGSDTPLTLSFHQQQFTPGR